MSILNQLGLKKKAIVPEVLQAIIWKLPDRLNVQIRKSSTGSLYATIKELPGCFTQADSGPEIYTMINDAIYTYFEVPREYIPFLNPYMPRSEEKRKELGISPEGQFNFQRI